MEVTVDTHTLVWFFESSLKNRLSRTARDALREAESEGTVYIPIIVLVEILHITEKGRIALDFGALLEKIHESENYVIIPLDIDILKIAINIKGLEAHDRLILAAALSKGTPLVSKDAELLQSQYDVVW